MILLVHILALSLVCSLYTCIYAWLCVYIVMMAILNDDDVNGRRILIKWHVHTTWYF